MWQYSFLLHSFPADITMATINCSCNGEYDVEHEDGTVMKVETLVVTLEPFSSNHFHLVHIKRKFSIEYSVFKYYYDCGRLQIKLGHSGTVQHIKHLPFMFTFHPWWLWRVKICLLETSLSSNWMLFRSNLRSANL